MNEVTLRLFVAVTLPENIRKAVAAAQAELHDSLPAHAISWTRPEQFHLTIKFLGAVRSEDAAPLAETLNSVGSRFKPLRLRAFGTGFFPNASRPRVVWAGLEDLSGQLINLHSDIEKAVQPFTREKPENRFHAHVTLGRVKIISREFATSMSQWADRQDGKIYGEWTADSLELMRSQLFPKGATHHVLNRTRLSA